MLVLSRRQYEGVTIGEGDSAVHVEVVEIMRYKVRLGFTGPDGVPIHRDEVVEYRRRKEGDDAT